MTTITTTITATTTRGRAEESASSSPPPPPLPLQSSSSSITTTIRFLKLKFGSYYKNFKPRVPPRFTRREWAFVFLEKDSPLRRHLAFNTLPELLNFIRSHIPKHIYHSAGYYSAPAETNMDAKGWFGADLIFDLDVDELLPENSKSNLNDEEALRLVKQECIKLLEDFILSDFGIDPKYITVVFSGKRGFHIHVRDPKVLTLDREARREIVDYINSKTIDISDIFQSEVFDVRGSSISTTFRLRELRKLKLPNPNEPGWRGKITRAIFKFCSEFEHQPKDTVVKILCSTKGIGRKTASNIYDDLFLPRRRTSNSGVNESSKDGCYYYRGVDILRAENNIEIFSSDRIRDAFIRFVMSKLALEELQAKIDNPVTSDTHRLIRMPDSLHGGTGLQVQIVPLDELKNFNPLNDAIVFSDTPVKVNITQSVNIRLKSESFKFEQGVETEVPEYVAVYLAAKRYCEIAVANF